MYAYIGETDRRLGDRIIILNLPLAILILLIIPFLFLLLSVYPSSRAAMIVAKPKNLRFFTLWIL